MPTINGKACVANGRNLIVQSDLKPGYINRDASGVTAAANNFYSDNYIPTNGATVFTFSSPDYAFKGSYYHNLVMYDSDKNFLGWQSITSPTQTLSQSNTAYIRFSINSKVEGDVSGNLSDWLNSHRYKLEVGATATPLTPAPVDKVFSDGKQVYGRNLLKNTGNLSSTSTTETWGTLFDSSKIYDSGIKSVSGVSAMTFSFDVYVPSNAEVGSYIPIQLKGQNSQAINYGTDGFNTLITYDTYAIKQSDLGKIIRSNIPVQKGNKYQSFDTAIADTVSIVIRQKSNVSGFVYSRIKLETGNLPTNWSPAPEDVM